LSLENAAGITSLEPPGGLTALESLSLNSAAGITSLDPLKELYVNITGASIELMTTLRR
jgi:hypothetical protein